MSTLKEILQKEYANGNIFEYSLSNISQIMKESSYLFYDFEDKKVELPYDEENGELGTYTKEVSPFFVKEVIDSEGNANLINIIDEEVPLYHIQPSGVRVSASDEEISNNRDSGINNVHSALQDNNFYEVWLRDVWGSLQNQLLLNSYNKLRWPIIGENQYITASLFPKLALEAFNEETTTDSSNLIEFRNSTEDNKEDNEFTEEIAGIDEKIYTKIGNIDYLNSIVEEKLSSVYDIIDYHPGKIDVLNAWVESLKESGQIEEEDEDRQTIIYKLQDIKYELLKRKYAGSRTLSKIILNSLDRQGSFISAVPNSIIDDQTKADQLFQDKRIVRLINLPGVTTDFESVIIYPLDYLPKKKDAPSLNDISSLYYTSGSSEGQYSAEDFFEGEYQSIIAKDESGAESTAEIHAIGKIKNLRKNVPYLNWNSLEGLSKGQATLKRYNKLDIKYLNNDNSSGYSWDKLDTKDPTAKNEEGKIVALKKWDGSEANYYFLDYTTEIVNASAENSFSVKDILDISADRLLFNKNVYQKENELEYPYVTYKIASGNSISLMDTVWMDYLKTSIENKSKVQEDITYGVQLNKFQSLQNMRLGEYNFFALASSENNIEDINNVTSLSSDSKYAYLCYCTIKYSVDESELFKVKAFTKRVISKITLKLKEEDYKDFNWDSLKEIDEFNQLTLLSKGLLPFTYFNVQDNSVLGLHYGPEIEEKEGVEDVNFYDDLENKNYSKAIFLFSERNVLSLKVQNRISGNITQESLLETLDEASNNLSFYPTLNTKLVYYVVKKGEDDYVVSSPIKVLPLEKVTFKEGDVFVPEWYDLCYFLNPYLNFTENSASPLRNKRVYSSESSVANGIDEIVEKVSDNIYLSNLTRTRGEEFLCCDKGEKESEWISTLEEDHPSRKYRGFYLDRQRPEFTIKDKNGKEVVVKEITDTLTVEEKQELKEFRSGYVDIYGDPRFIDVYDLRSEASGEENATKRGKVYIDGNNGLKCLHFESSVGPTEDTEEEKALRVGKENYFRLRPGSNSSKPTEEDYNNWWWIQGGKKEEEDTLDGLAIFMSFYIDPVDTFEGPYENPYLLQYTNEFALKLSREAIISNDGEKSNENYKYILTFEYNGSEVPPKEIENIEDIIRVGISVDSSRILFLVNDKLTSWALETKVSRKVGSSADTYHVNQDIFIGTDKDAPGTKHCFLGNIYDLRLYTRGFNEKELRILSQGSFRETYSEAPDLHVLAYNNYRDLGVFKEIGLRVNDTSLDTVDIVRIFNRNVWDSILLDLCPILVTREASIDVGSPFFRKDYEDPKNDTDIYGWVNGEKNIKDCIELSLETFEKQNNVTLALNNNESTTVKYNGMSYTLSGTNSTSLINTTLYPVYYDRASMKDNVINRFHMEGNLIKSGEVENVNDYRQGLQLPMAFNSANKDLKYEADFTLNFTIPVASNFTNFYSKGTNISLEYNTSLEKAVVSKGSSGENSSQTNHILIPLTVPRQKDVSSYNSGYFDRMYLSGVEINDGLNTLLKATSYYNELRVPVVFDIIENSSRGISYASKWDALRTLKEGTYYITCKYPFQILPFTDYLYDINSQAKYDYLYATVRFKIEVSGSPIMYEKGLNGADDITTSYLAKYDANTLNSTLRSTSALLNPEDNRTFPHRQINIDLYVQDIKGNDIAGRMSGAEETYEYQWTLLGTNHPDNYNSTAEYILLDRSALESSLTIERKIPVFFSKNYTSPFFIAKTEKREGGTTRVNSASADDDLIDPIKINPVYSDVKLTSFIKAEGAAVEGTVYYEYDSDSNSYSEKSEQPGIGDPLGNNSYIKIESLDNLQIEKESDLDNLTLVAGRAYKMLWDYTGYVSELSYVDKVYSQNSSAAISLANTSAGSPYYEMSDEEKTNYSRMSSLLESEGLAEYIYSENGSGYRTNDVHLSGKTNGYCIDNKEYIECSIQTRESDPKNNDIIALGGTYSLISYIVYEVKNENEVPTTVPEGVLYFVKGAGYYWSGEDGNRELLLGSDMLTYPEDNSFSFGYFYKKNSTSIFRAGISLDNKVFKIGDTYKVWNLFDLEELKVDEGSYDNISSCPLPGSAGKIYLKTKDANATAFTSCFRLVGSAPHFTDISRGVVDSSYSSEDFYFGNPYSRSGERNYLLKIRDASSSYSRSNIINSWYFPYTPTEIPEGQYLSSMLLTPSTPLEVIKSSSLDTTQIVIDERSILNTQHEYMVGVVNAAIKRITSGNTGGSQKDTSGIFSAISSIEPYYQYTANEGNVQPTIAQATYVRSTKDDLVAYSSSDRVYPSKNENILITRRGLYSNNLVTNQDMDNSVYWTWGNLKNLIGQGSSAESNLYAKTYVSDLDWDDGRGKDVCEVTFTGYGRDNITSNNTNNPLSVKYAKGSTLIGAVYEVALNIQVEGKTYDDSSKTWQEEPTRFYMWAPSESAVTSESGETQYEVSYIFKEVTSQVKYYSGEDFPAYGEISGGSSILVKKSNLEKAYAYPKGFSNNLLQDKKELTISSYDSSMDANLNKTQTTTDNTLYVKSKANEVTVYASFLAKGKLVKQIRMYVSSLSQTSENAKGLTAFDNVWYTISAEPDSIVTADSIVYSFACTSPVKFKITKAVVRKSDSRIHALGLSDGIYTKKTAASDSSVIVTAHKCISFRNIDTQELIPIQFNASVGERASTSNYNSKPVKYVVSGLNKVEDFITRYSLESSNSNKKVESLSNPWTRKLKYSRLVNTTVESVYFDKETGKIYESKLRGVYKNEITPDPAKTYYFVNGTHEIRYKAELTEDNIYKYTSLNIENGKYYTYDASERIFKPSEDLGFVESAAFYNYRIVRGTNGVKSLQVESLPSEDIFSNGEIEYIDNTRESTLTRSYLWINSLDISNFLSSRLFNTNLEITEDNKTFKKVRGDDILSRGPLTITNAKVTTIANCFDEGKFKKGEDNRVAITNIQLLNNSTNAEGSKNKRVLFEIEYPPVIYNEKDQHLSLNILLQKIKDSDTILED